MANPKDGIYKDDAKGQDAFAAMLLALAGGDKKKIEDAKKKVEGGKKK